MSKILIIVLSFLIIGYLHAQQSEIQFENITTVNGLADDDVTFVVIKVK